MLDCILSDGTQAAALLSIFRGVARRIVALSSQDVYRAVNVLHGLEEGLEPVPLTEDSPLRTKMHPYPPQAIAAMRSVFPWLNDDYDKIPVERAILSDGGLPGTVLRLPMVYGPGDPLRRFHPVLKRIDDGRPAILIGELAAGWRGTRGYVENVAAAVALALTSERAGGRIYNVGDPDTLTEAEWAGEIAAATGWPGRIAILPDSRLPKHLLQTYRLEQHWVTDTARIRGELGYREPLARRDAIERTIAWERATPVNQFPFAAFDYRAEDAALAANITV